MILEARSANCFSSAFVLKANERAIGKIEARWFSEWMDVHLTERRYLEYRKVGWFGSQFELVDVRDEELLCHGQHTGLFTRTWDVTLSEGAGQLVSAGWFETAFEFRLGDETLARVDRLGWCERGWIVDGADILTVEDLIMLGLVYHTIQRRRNRQNNAGGAAAS
ncbi:MAG: hypothetical protein HYX68_13085 [Planctomycetes bacterium]|nr:hypothetical protein [Planctomycetota bacterium]